MFIAITSVFLFCLQKGEKTHEKKKKDGQKKWFLKAYDALTIVFSCHIFEYLLMELISSNDRLFF